MSTDEQSLCVVCMDAPKTHAIVPCGHVCVGSGSDKVPHLLVNSAWQWSRVGVSSYGVIRGVYLRDPHTKVAWGAAPRPKPPRTER